MPILKPFKEKKDYDLQDNPDFTFPAFSDFHPVHTRLKGGGTLLSIE